MIIHPEGLFDGERLAACSDEAQLHFPRLVGMCNGYGRMELSASQILERAYGSFRVKPTREQLTAWLREFHAQYLLYIYSDGNGAIWGQWCMPKSALPRHKDAEARRSPAPIEEDFQEFEQTYFVRKQEKLKSSGDHINISDDFGNVPKCSEARENVSRTSEDFGGFPLGIGGGVGVGEGVGGGKSLLSSGDSPEEASEHDPDPEPHPPTNDAERRASVKRVFDYYLKETGRKLSQYALTELRMRRALKALRECEKRFGVGPPAETALGQAVTGLLANDWNMGRDPRSNGKKYIEWEDHIFRDVETMERRWSDGGFDPDVHT